MPFTAAQTAATKTPLPPPKPPKVVTTGAVKPPTQYPGQPTSHPSTTMSGGFWPSYESGAYDIPSLTPEQWSSALTGTDYLSQWGVGQGTSSEFTNPNKQPSTSPGEGYRWEWSSYDMRWVPQPFSGDWLGGAETGGMTEYQLKQIEEERWWREQQLAQGQAGSEYEQFLMNWYPEQLGMEQTFQREQLAAEQAWRNQQIATQKQAYEAQLSAQPKSWLEYAAYTGQQPAIQPWMQPLMPEQYSQTQPGQQIPGWSQSSMTGMPELINPSAQYLARMGPTAQQQWLGYQQAQTGAPGQESAWRAQQMAPPGGSKGLTRYR